MLIKMVTKKVHVKNFIFQVFLIQDIGKLLLLPAMFMDGITLFTGKINNGKCFAGIAASYILDINNFVQLFLMT